MCPGSFMLAALTALIVWVAVAELLRQGRLGEVLSAGRAELAAPLLVALVVGTGICERIWPAERRPVLARGHVQDACFLTLHAIVVIPLMTLLSVGAATLIGGHAHWLALRATEQWPGWLLVPSPSWPWTEPTGWPITLITGSVRSGASTPCITARRN